MKKTVKKTVKKSSGLSAEVFDVEGKVVGKIDLPKEIFNAEVNSKLLAQAVRVYLANQRQGTASTKTRGEVAGSTRKIYRQKGTGRARHGSLKAPIFVGGGIIFGPKPRDFSLKLPRKARLKALFAALTDKFKNNEVLVVGELQKIKAKTKEMIEFLGNLKLEIVDGKLQTKTLLVLPKPEKNILLACQNIQNLTATNFNLLNPYLVLAHQKIIFTKQAIEMLCNLWKTPKS